MTHSFEIVAFSLPTFNSAVLAMKHGQNYVVSSAPSINQTIVVPIPLGMNPFDAYDVNTVLRAEVGFGIYNDGPSFDEALERYENGVFETEQPAALTEATLPVETPGYTFVKVLPKYQEGRLYTRDEDGQPFIVSRIDVETTVFPVFKDADPEDVMAVFLAGLSSPEGSPWPQFFPAGTSHEYALSHYTGEAPTF